ncbi:MAG: DUF3987 domain-containing protein [Trichocoleus desertorum ATA4-8-CV12]|nr:DUF3987 domain-containing protein [Trichocoleus desertorum ATA4-8-CV12]
MLSDIHSSKNAKPTPQQLLGFLKAIPGDWALVAVGDNKAPIGKNWQNTPLTKQDFEVAAQSGQFKRLAVERRDSTIFHPPVSWVCAIGVLCGTASGGLVFVDHDGSSCDDLIQKLSGQSLELALPKTVSVTSGREGRHQSIYRIPERFWGAIATKKIRTGVIGEDGKADQLELRWDGCQSVVSGHHPITGAYRWRLGLSPEECGVAEAPNWIIEQMIEEQPSQLKLQYGNRLQSSIERDRALSFLAAIPPTEDYGRWIEVGMALHYVSEDLLEVWDDWSQGAANYQADACAKHWRSFKKNGGVGLGTLGLLAKQNGWRSPSSKNEGDRQIHTLAGRDKINQQPPLPSEDSENLEELAEEVQSLVKIVEEAAPVQSLLSPLLTTPLQHRANQFNIPLECFIGILLPVAASLLRIDTCLEIDPNTDFRPPPILWVGLVGPSGSTKSPIYNTLLNPLEKLQTDADIAYQTAFTQYKEELAQWEKNPKDERGDAPKEPAQREYYLQDVTLEAVAACLGKQPGKGTIVAADELTSVLAGFNQYRARGQGNDRQKWLSMYDGKPFKVNRKTESRISVPRTSVSLAGTIQPDVLQKYMGTSEEGDGYWSRYLWVPLSLTKMPPPGEGSNYNLFGLLQSIYRALENLPSKTYQLDHKGHQIWRAWHCLCEDQKVSEPNSVLRAIYPKAKERAARIALIAHCVNAVAEDRLPGPIVSSETLEAAIAFTKWSIGQARLIYADSGITLHYQSPEIVRFIERFKRNGWISARQVTHWSSGRKKLKADAARAFMGQVVNLGYAIDNGEKGKAYRICIKNSDINAGNNETVIPYMTGGEAGNKAANKLVTNKSASLESHLNMVSGYSNTVYTAPINLRDEQLPEVTSVVTPSESSLNKEVEGFCYQVTGVTFNVGDRVVLSGEGNQRPPDELKAVWIVRKIEEQGVTIYDDVLGRRLFPIEWLLLYQSSAK